MYIISLIFTKGYITELSPNDISNLKNKRIHFLKKELVMMLMRKRNISTCMFLWIFVGFAFLVTTIW